MINVKQTLINLYHLKDDPYRIFIGGFVGLIPYILTQSILGSFSVDYCKSQEYLYLTITAIYF